MNYQICNIGGKKFFLLFETKMSMVIVSGCVICKMAFLSYWRHKWIASFLLCSNLMANLGTINVIMYSNIPGSRILLSKLFTKRNIYFPCISLFILGTRQGWISFGKQWFYTSSFEMTVLYSCVPYHMLISQEEVILKYNTFISIVAGWVFPKTLGMVAG
jgi:hypothetical protein